jgi:type II secretory pathway component PulM
MTNLLAGTAAKIIAGLGLLIFLLALYVWFTWDNAAQPKQDARSANASAMSAKEAAETVIENAAENATVDQLVASAAQKIEDAPTPEVAALEARSAICAFAEYRNKPECRP